MTKREAMRLALELCGEIIFDEIHAAYGEEEYTEKECDKIAQAMEKISDDLKRRAKKLGPKEPARDPLLTD